jgi:hypothetical protein
MFPVQMKRMVFIPANLGNGAGEPPNRQTEMAFGDKDFAAIV